MLNSSDGSGNKLQDPPGFLQTRKFSHEVEMFHGFVQLVQDSDPDVMLGYEAQTMSLGFLVARAAKLDMNLPPMISRMPGNERESRVDEDQDS